MSDCRGRASLCGLRSGWYRTARVRQEVADAESRRLLRQGKDNVEEIAMRIGYESGRIQSGIQAEIGVAPGHYRRAASPVDAR